MDLLTCEYCGMEFSKEYTHCPLCGRSVHPTLVGMTLEDPIYNRKTKRKGGRFAQKQGRSGKQTSDQPKAEKPRTDNPYAIPKAAMIVICAILGAAVLGGAIFALNTLGHLDWLLHPARLEQAPEQETTPPAATEEQYTNEEDYTNVTEPGLPVAQPVPCSGLTLSTSSITFDEPELFFNMTVVKSPQDCTDPVIYVSTNEKVATVSEQGKIVAVGGGTAQVIATCGEFSQTCLVTCDFLTEADQQTQEQEAPALSSSDLTFTYPGQQATLLVLNVEDEAEIDFESADSSIASISSAGQITAVSSGTTTVTATVHDLTLECIVRCVLDDSAETTGEDAEGCTISHADVTMSILNEYFRLYLKDANGDRIKGVKWMSSDTSVCVVDEDGIVTAVGRGTTTVYATYGGVSFECIVRCPIE